MALLLLYFFLVAGELYSCNAQTTDGSTSPSAETVRNANATADTTVTNVNATAETTVGYANTTAETTVGYANTTAETTVGSVNTTAETTVGSVNTTAETTVGYANTTAETTVTTVNATVGPGCSDPPILCCAGQNNGCLRKTCFCDQACVTFRDCCSDFNLTCMHYFQAKTLHLKVSLLTRGGINNSGISQALLSYFSRILLQPTCINCSLRIKNIVFN